MWSNIYEDFIYFKAHGFIKDTKCKYLENKILFHQIKKFHSSYIKGYNTEKK